MREVLINKNRERGVVLVFFALSLLVVFGIAALTVDLGYGYLHKQRLQRAADSASLFVAKDLQQASADPNSQALAMLNANALSDASFQVECGNYNPNNYTFSTCTISCASGPCRCTACTASGVAGTTNAVRVTATHSTGAFFARLLGTNTLQAQVQSVSQGGFSNSTNCVRPFGIDGTNSGPLHNVAVGSNFTIASPSAGNWGKLNIGPVDLNGNSQTDAWSPVMITGACDSDLVNGQQIDVVTGAAGNPGQTLLTMQSLGLTDYMTVPLTNGFGNGNQPVTIIGFARVSLVTVSNINGKNFSATFRLDALNVDPPNGNGSGTVTQRKLVAQSIDF